MTLYLRPPRRDPRPLVLRTCIQGLAYVALDAWELRGHGVLRVGRMSDLSLALLRLVLQIKPSVIVFSLGHTASDRLAHSIVTIARTSHLVAMPLSATTTTALLRGAPKLDAIALQYPEVRLLAADDPTEVVRLAVRCLTHLALPSRFYAPRHPARAKTRVAPGGARRARPPRGALPTPALGPRR